MKYTLFFCLSAGLLLASCANDNKPTPADIKTAEDQVAKDQAAIDSLDKIIQQQIESVSDDSLMKAEH